MFKILFKILPILLLVMLTGCSGIIPTGLGTTPGMASYELERKANGDCRVRISSGRELAAGSIEIGKECELQAKADAVTGANAQLRMLDVVGSAIQRIPPAASKP